MRFTDELRELAKDSWEQSLDHPFVQGVVKGDLSLEVFRYYILQDIYYLKHYGKVHAMAAAQADDFSVTAMLAGKAKSTAQAELTVHDGHASILNITAEDLEYFKPAPTTYSYPSHLYRAPAPGSLAQTVAATMPCYWLRAQIGTLNEQAEPEKEMYRTIYICERI